MATYDKIKMQKTAQGIAATWWEKAFGIWGAKIGTMPKIEMNSRLTSCGGRAFMLTARNAISHPDMIEKADFSCYLMERNPYTYRHEVIPHELAHFIALRVYGEENHGHGWKYVMQELGVPVERCHSMQTKSRAEKDIQARKRITSRVG